MSKVCHLSCQHYVFKGCCDVICDVTVLHCVGHVTFYYKMPTNALVGILACCLSICQVQLYYQRPMCGWCLTCVGHDTSSMSSGWSLLPSTVIIVLALVNSAVSPAGIPSISTRPESAALLPVSTTSTGLLRLLVGAHVHCVRSDTEKYHVWLLLRAHHFQCVTYIHCIQRSMVLEDIEY